MSDYLVPDDLPTVVLHPKSLVIGMGAPRHPDRRTARVARPNVDGNRLALASITTPTSVDAKADEPALQALAAELGVDFVTYPADRLAGIEAEPQPGARRRGRDAQRRRGVCWPVAQP